MRRLIHGEGAVARAIAVAIVLVLGSWSSTAAAVQGTAAQCQPAGPLVRMSGLPEASGLAVSGQVPGRLWTHNDSGEPVVFSLDAAGSVTGRVRLTGATVEDWEAIAVGPCGGGSCLYVADIGDNDARRRRITIHRLPEPDGSIASVPVVDTFHATYPDGPQDAETLLIGSDGRLYIVTKGETGPIAIYRFPVQLRSGANLMLERVGAPASAKPDAESRITDGAISPDGQWTVLRTRSSLTFYPTSELLAGRWRATHRVDLTPLKEPQGEGVAIGPDNTVFVAGEGGGRRQPGTFARFTCAPGLRVTAE